MVQDTVPIFFTYFSPSDEFFLVLVLMPRILRADFLQEGMSRKGGPLAAYFQRGLVSLFNYSSFRF